MSKVSPLFLFLVSDELNTWYLGHYQAYTVGKVLHRDLSENNLMFKRKDGEVKGIVNDWDMASILNDAGEVLTSAAKHGRELFLSWHAIFWCRTPLLISTGMI